MRDLGERARHVIVRRHHDQRAEALAFGPALDLDRVAAGVAGAIDIDATVHIAGEFRVETGYFGDRGRPVQAADEQALAAPGRQEFERVGDARSAAGQRHDAVGIAMERNFGGRHPADEPHEPASYCRHGGESDDCRRSSDAPQPPAPPAHVRLRRRLPAGSAIGPLSQQRHPHQPRAKIASNPAPR